MEVANLTNFHEQFIHASSNRTQNEEEPTILMATIMAMGTKIGLTKMAEATPSISYRQMANAAQWRLYEDPECFPYLCTLCIVFFLEKY